MQRKPWLGRLFALSGLVVLAACQTVPQQPSATDAAAPAVQSSTPAAASSGQPSTTAATQDRAQQIAPVLVFLADTNPQPDWIEVDIQPNGKLYVQPEAFLGVEDLTNVEAGRSESGDGLLAIELNEAATANLTRITTQNPNKRLALVVDGTMLAVPGYSEPITVGRLVFMVGSEQNALTAARIIAGENATPESAPGAAKPAPATKP